MAIDTKAKRASVQAMTFGLVRPPPDGTVSEPDRGAVAWIYSGIDFAGPPPPLQAHRWFMWFFGFSVDNFEGYD